MATSVPSVTRVLEFAQMLRSTEHARAARWADPLGTDITRALHTCPHATWLAALARALGAEA